MIIHHLPDGDIIHQYKKSIVILFHGKRHVISTGPNNGGFREDLLAVFNNDANPGPGMACIMKDDTYEGHMNKVALEDLGLDPARCTGLCTAASMDNAAIESMTYKGLTVTAIITAGIEHNGGRAGDPASFYEEAGRFHSLTDQEDDHDNSTSGQARETACVIEKTGGRLPLPDGQGVMEKAVGLVPGTINMILHMNASLDPGTLARTMMTATEAKTAALQELLARSHLSCGLATGSGTDGLICISNPASPLKLTNAGKNSKLGELIGKTVKTALKKALYRQSGLGPERQRDVLRIMGRFGTDEDCLWEDYQKLSKDLYAADGSLQTKADFIDRLDRIKGSGTLIETSLLYAHTLDLLQWGLISRTEAEGMTGRLLEGSKDIERTPGSEINLIDRFVRHLFFIMQGS